jgi:hypothetical protein
MVWNTAMFSKKQIMNNEYMANSFSLGLMAYLSNLFFK